MGLTINENAIQSKVRAFGQTSTGKSLIKQAIQTKMETGVSICKITGNIVDEAKMMEAANKMKSLLSQYSMGLPASIQAIVNNVWIGPLRNIGDGKYEIDLSFQGSFTRPSLIPTRYGYVDNIVALFNNGYYAKHVVWAEHFGVKVGSRQERSGLHFVNQAVSTFNSTCGLQYNAKAEASWEYV